MIPGFWACAARRVPLHAPGSAAGCTAPQRCWDVAQTTPPRRQGGTGQGSTGRAHGLPRFEAVKIFADTFAEFPKATAKITGDLDVLLAFYDFPFDHWIHLRTIRMKESSVLSHSPGFSRSSCDGRAVKAGGAARRGSLDGPG